ncbi:MAG: MFS transporter [Guyparkeria sp.]|uniref:MFS transporter n=1 Tax=Guyparkeria sp. TaxID=2035736 RepID=UPI0039793037
MPHPDPVRLLSRRFLPYFLTQALGAFNDNAFRFSVMFMLTYRISTDESVNVDVLMNLAAGLFILPFLLFSPMAGHLTDRVDQARLARILKGTELALMCLAGVGFWLQSVPLLLALVFLMGTQSAWFGPLKYAIMPRHIPADHLMRANGWVTASTFVAILGGTLTGGLLAAAGEMAALWASLVVIAVAIAGVIAARLIPAAPALDTVSSPAGPIRSWYLNWRLLRRQPAALHQAMWLISWFWFVGAGYLTQFPRFSREWLGLGADGATGLLALFALSIGAGGLAVGYLSSGRPRLGLAPFASLGVAVAALDWYLAASVVGQSPSLLRIGLDIAATGFFAGMLVVPLYSYLQTRTTASRRARIIALLNVQNALAMVVSSLLGMVLFAWFDIQLPTFFLLFGGSGLLVSLMLWWKWRGLRPGSAGARGHP